MISRKKLLELMNQNKTTIQDLALSLNVNYSTINRIVNGETLAPRMETIHALANFFGVDPSFICEGSNEAIADSKKRSVIFKSVRDLLLCLMNITGIKSSTLLHRYSGVSKAVLDKILSGETLRPNLKTLQHLAEYLNLTVEQINGEKPIPLYALSEVSLSRKLLPILTLDDIKPWMRGNRNNVAVTNYIHSTLFVGQTSFAIKIIDGAYEPEFFKNSVLVIDTQADVQLGSYLVVLDNKVKNASIFVVESINDEEVKMCKASSPHEKLICSKSQVARNNDPDLQLNFELPKFGTVEVAGVIVQELRTLQ